MSAESFGITEFQLSDLLKDTNVIVCDLRKKEDFAKGHIKKSVLVKFDPDGFVDTPKNSKIIFVSYDEEQSKKITLALRSQGLNAFYLLGGIKNWTRGLYCTNISYVGTGYP